MHCAVCTAAELNTQDVCRFALGISRHPGKHRTTVESVGLNHGQALKQKQSSKESL